MSVNAVTGGHQLVVMNFCGTEISLRISMCGTLIVLFYTSIDLCVPVVAFLLSGHGVCLDRLQQLLRSGHAVGRREESASCQRPSLGYTRKVSTMLVHIRKRTVRVHGYDLEARGAPVPHCKI